MNKRQKQIMTGVKPDRRESKPPVTTVHWGPSPLAAISKCPLAAIAKWVDLLEVLKDAALRQFIIGSVGIPNDIARGEPTDQNYASAKLCE